MQPQVEPYLTPKGISSVLKNQYGVKLSADYVRWIRKESIRRGEKKFVGGCGRASDVFEFLKANPYFSRSMARRYSKKERNRS